jgi:hypothetical protein
MKVNKVSEYVLNDENDNEIRIKHMEDCWHLVVEDDSIFSFSVDDAADFVRLFQEIGKM